MSGFQRQQRFRQRQAAAGQTRFELWLDATSAATLERLAGERSEPTRKARLTAVVVAALQAPAGSGSHYPPVDAQPEPEPELVTGNAQSDTATLETRVLELHNRGLTLAEIARALASEGIVGMKGTAYHPSSIGRIKERVLRRRV